MKHLENQRKREHLENQTECYSDLKVLVSPRGDKMNFGHIHMASIYGEIFETFS